MSTKQKSEDTKNVIQDSNETEKDKKVELPTLDLQDLVVVLNLLNLAIKRGAYEPSELTTVGVTYNKLERFLKFQAELQKNDKPDEKGDS